MEPSDALRSIETALRLAIRQIFDGDEWLAVTGAPDKEKLVERQQEEQRRRDGTVVSSDLLDYVETYHLTGLVSKNWEKFKPIFDDKGRTDAFFGIIMDVRNSVAHSRDLVTHERELISGIAGMIRNQVSLFRSKANSSAVYYPLIESVKDGFGLEGVYGHRSHGGPRVEVGDELTFSGSAFGARGKSVRWRLLKYRSSYLVDVLEHEVPVGDQVTFSYTVVEDDVSEHFTLVVHILAESRFHRHRDDMGVPSHDDSRMFTYAVNPPMGE
ncbi:hypothetical protein AB0H12_40855 [Actinosynnema sp. NPDC023794]